MWYVVNDRSCGDYWIENIDTDGMLEGDSYRIISKHRTKKKAERARTVASALNFAYQVEQHPDFYALEAAKAYARLIGNPLPEPNHLSEDIPF